MFPDWVTDKKWKPYTLDIVQGDKRSNVLVVYLKEQEKLCGSYTLQLVSVSIDNM